jgi:hypothetical protein
MNIAILSIFHFISLAYSEWGCLNEQTIRISLWMREREEDGVDSAILLWVCMTYIKESINK